MKHFQQLLIQAIKFTYFSSCTAAKAFFGLNVFDGKTQVDPWVSIMRAPMTEPKQWYNGTGIQIRAFCFYKKKEQRI